ncbi:MAG: hypothetical protein NVSMB64_18630 [Candidatus Velthaea sp.]
MDRIIASFRPCTQTQSFDGLSMASQWASVAGYAQRLGVESLVRTREVEAARRDSFKKCP